MSSDYLFQWKEYTKTSPVYINNREEKTFSYFGWLVSNYKKVYFKGVFLGANSRQNIITS